MDRRTCDLASPVVNVKSNAKKTVRISWKKVENAKKYEVYRATAKKGKFTKVAITTKLSYTNKSLKSGKTYYYKVKAIASNAAANSAYCKTKSVKCK